MTVKTYLETMNSYNQITFIKARARKDANTPFYHAEYQTTPIHQTEDCLKNGYFSDYIILNDKQAPIEWLSGIKYSKYTKCLLIISPKDFELLYAGEEQRQNIIDYIDSKISVEYKY